MMSINSKIGMSVGDINCVIYTWKSFRENQETNFLMNFSWNSIKVDFGFSIG